MDSDFHLLTLHRLLQKAFAYREVISEMCLWIGLWIGLLVHAFKRPCAGFCILFSYADSLYQFMDWSRHNYVTSIISTEKSIYRLVNSMIRMNCDRRRGHQRLTSSRSSGAGCPVMLTNVAAGAGRLVISVALFLVSSVTGKDSSRFADHGIKNC